MADMKETVRRVLLWFAGIAAFAICATAVIAAALLIMDVVGKHRLKAIAERSPSFYVKEQSATLVLDHVSIIDGTGAAPRDDQSVVIENGKISYAGAHSEVPKKQDAKVLDLSGRTVLPGLVAMHEHLFTTAPSPSRDHALIEQSTVFPLMYLAAGVTTMRTAGSIAPERDLVVKQKIDQGAAVGPEMFLTAPYLEGMPPALPDMHGLANPQEAHLAVDYWADRGMTSLKAYMNITPEELQEAALEAHARGLKITAHLCSIGLREAVDLGLDNLENGLLTDTEFYSKKRPGVCPDVRLLSLGVQHSAKRRIRRGSGHDSLSGFAPCSRHVDAGRFRKRVLGGPSDRRLAESSPCNDLESLACVTAASEDGASLEGGLALE
ncbi:MAG TPA: hypothetical protein VJS11_04065 [Acidobacteriaceae bacterium]|nr:hypothetical protein [Acidobacteriaceae bacterium]